MNCRSLSSFRARPLASCIATLFGLGLGDAALAATTHYVTTCAYDGDGSISSILGDAGLQSGDTIDFSNVAPCTVTLAAELFTQLDDLTIQAPAGKPVLFSGSANHRQFVHFGAGLVRFDFIDFDAGGKSDKYTAVGGCIFSSAGVEVDHGNITNCTAHAKPPTYPTFSSVAEGSAIYAQGQVTLKQTTISASTVWAETSHPTIPGGGAVFARSGIDIEDSTISGNLSKSVQDNCGAVYTPGNLTIRSSTISGNAAGGANGGVCAGGTVAAYAHIYSSTISGNTAAAGTGGIALSSTNVVVANSTIAFNSAPDTGGLSLFQTATARVQSTIMSNNSASSGDLDFAIVGATTPVFDAASSNNFIRVPGNSAPPGTTTDVCPKLGPLHENGGATQTHALASDSPAIDAGSNPYDEAADQRGDPLLYPRSSGIGPDAGAYEVNQADSVFVDFFDGCD